MAFNKRIAFLGKLNSIKIENVNFISFENINTALMDYDILIFHPLSFYTIYINLIRTNYHHEDYEDYEDYNIKSLIWVEKIYKFISNNKNIFILATQPLSFSENFKNLYTFSEKFENAHSFYIINKILKFKNMNIESGETILKKSNSILDNFYNRFEKSLKYHITYENVIFDCALSSNILPVKNKINSQSIDIFIGRDKNRILSSIIKIYNGGNILLLPEVVFEETKDLTDLLNIIVEIDKKLKNIKNPKPQWLENNDNYSISISESIKSKLADIDKEINKLNEKKTELNQNLEKEEQIKDLLFENGKPLENAIIEALRILGYEAENIYIDNNEIDILATSPEGEIFCCEAEGKDNNAIDITKFRQLLDHIAIYKEHIEYKSNVNGILFGNAYRKEELANRPEEYFTGHCLQGSMLNNFILIRTTDLFFAVRDIKNCNNNIKVEEYKNKCREAILNSKGKIVVFPKIEIS